MVNSQALMLVPSSKLSCFAQAFIMVSNTKTSAMSKRPESEKANARRLGIVASSSRLKLGPSVAWRPVLGSSRRVIGLALLFDLIELLQQFEELVGDRFLLHGAVQRPELGADIRIGSESVIGSPRARGGRLLHVSLFFHYRAFANSAAGAP